MEESGLIEQLKALKGAGAPDVGFIKRGRNALLSEIEIKNFSESRASIPSRVFDWFKLLHFQTIAVGAFALILVAGGVAAAREAHQSLPGDRLYVVKRTAFQASKLLPRSDEARLESEFQFVNRTIDELEFVATQDAGVRNSEAYKAVIVETANDMKNFHKNLSKAQEKSGSKIAPVARRVANESKTLLEGLDSVATHVPAVVSEVVAAKESVQQADVAALKVVAGAVTEDSDEGRELEDMVQQRLLTLAQQAADLQRMDPGERNALEPVHEDIKAAQSLVLGGEYQAAVGHVDTALAYLTQRQRMILEQGGGKVITAPLDGVVKGVKAGVAAPVTDVFVGTDEVFGSTSTVSTTPAIISQETTTTPKKIQPAETPEPVVEGEAEFSIGE